MNGHIEAHLAAANAEIARLIESTLEAARRVVAERDAAIARAEKAERFSEVAKAECLFRLDREAQAIARADALEKERDALRNATGDLAGPWPHKLGGCDDCNPVVLKARADRDAALARLDKIATIAKDGRT